MRVGCLGEVMLELIAGKGGAARLGIAGDTYNTAVYLARALGPGRVDYITVLGQDAFSTRITEHMARYDVGTHRVTRHDSRIPGLYAIETDADGERSFTYWRSASAARTLGETDLEAALAGLDLVFYSGISLAILSPEGRARLFEALRAFRAGGGAVAFDSNHRPHLWEDPTTARAQTALAWQSCDIGLPSVDDEMTLFGDEGQDAVLSRLAGYGLGLGALKRGAAGPVSLAGQPMAGPRPAAVKVVDSTAAGDSFNAGYLAARLQGGAEPEALAAGHALAADVVQHRGAIVFGGKDP